MTRLRDTAPLTGHYALADSLLHAQAKGVLVEPPSITDGLTLDEAYHIGALIARRRIRQGWGWKGWKVGFTNREIWSKWGLDQPIVGPVYDETVFDVGTGSTWARNREPPPVPAGRRAALMIEVEVVFGFDGPATTAGRHPMPDWVALGAELVDCHYAGWRLHPADAVADFGLHAGLVIGPRVQPVSADAVEALRDVVVSLSASGERLAAGKGRAVLDGPANVLAELYGPLAERTAGYGVTGGSKRGGDGGAGYLVSTGTLTPLVEATIGTTYEAEADQLPSFSFALV